MSRRYDALSMASMHGPWQRLMWYRRQGRASARLPSLMSIVQVRNGNSRRTRFIASSTELADAYGPKYRLPSCGSLRTRSMRGKSSPSVILMYG